MADRTVFDMRITLLLVAIVVLGVGGWLAFRDGGLLNQVTEERVADALILNGVPVGMAECMAPRLTERLSISQLRQPENLKPVEQLAIVGTRCGVDSRLKRFRG